MTVFEIAREPLLSRGDFKELTLGSLQGRCAFCSDRAVDAHHILDRKLFGDGGYYRSNGAPLCARHHWECEMTVLGLEVVRTAAGASQMILPGSMAASGFARRYDKWGNEFLTGAWAGYRLAGPLGWDTGMIKALSAAGLRAWLLDVMPKGD